MLKSFEVEMCSYDESKGLKRFERALAAQARRLVKRGKGYEKIKALEQPDGVTDLAAFCGCGCCMECLFQDGVLTAPPRYLLDLKPIGREGYPEDADISDDFDEDEEEFDESEEDEEMGNESEWETASDENG